MESSVRNPTSLHGYHDREWTAAAGDLKTPTVSVESYPTEPGFIRASVELVKQGLAETKGATRVLFSTHGIVINALVGINPAEGEMVIVKAGVGGEPSVVGRLRVE